MAIYIKKLSTSFLFLFLLSFSFSEVHSQDTLRSRDVEEEILPYHPAAVSFFVVDLKYSTEYGVQVCEIQPSIISKFAGFDFVNSTKGAAAENFCDYLSTLLNNFWYVSGRVTDKSFIDIFEKRGWSSERANSSIAQNGDFAAAMSQPIYDPSDIHNYNGLLYTRVSRLNNLDKFLQDFPGVIVVDSATYKYGTDKYVMNKLLGDDELLRQIKPAWNQYPKKYSLELVNQVKAELGSEMFVIKPRRSTLGRGVIIVDKENLAHALKKVTKHSSKLLPKGSDDNAYNYWKNDRSDSFLVEAYAPSETTYVPHLDNKPYDPTMRVGVILVHSEGKTDIHFVACYWKLPLKSLSEKGSLSELHKSYGKKPHFAEVSEEVQQQVEKQLSETLPHMFEIMLGH